MTVRNSIVNAIQDLQAGGVPISSASLKIAGCTLGPPITCNGTGFPLNNGTNPAGSNTIDYGLPNSVSVDNALGKVDYQINAKNTLSGMYFYGDNNGTVQDASATANQMAYAHSHPRTSGGLELGLDARPGVGQRSALWLQPLVPTNGSQMMSDTPASDYGLNTGVTNPLYGGLPRINILGLDGFPASGLGGFNWPKVQGPDTDTSLWTTSPASMGKHSLKFGGEIHRDGFEGGAYGGARGQIQIPRRHCLSQLPHRSRTSLRALLPTEALLIGDPTRDIHNWGIALFAQDDWRITSHLTIESWSALRTEYRHQGLQQPIGQLQSQRGTRAGRQGNQRPVQCRSIPTLLRAAGFAWDIDGNNRTVIRGGAGITYETINWEAFLALNNNLGLSTIPTGRQWE